jgi:hypothetical protein
VYDDKVLLWFKGIGVVYIPLLTTICERGMMAADLEVFMGKVNG